MSNSCYVATSGPPRLTEHLTWLVTLFSMRHFLHLVPAVPCSPAFLSTPLDRVPGFFCCSPLSLRLLHVGVLQGSMNGSSSSPPTLNSLMISFIIMALNINSLLTIPKLVLRLDFPRELRSPVYIPAYLPSLLGSKHLKPDMSKINPTFPHCLHSPLLLPPPANSLAQTLGVILDFFLFLSHTTSSVSEHPSGSTFKICPESVPFSSPPLLSP